MEEYVKITLGIITALIVGGGALFTIRKSRQRKTTVKQDHITIKGNNNKVIGGDDNSLNAG